MPLPDVKLRTEKKRGSPHSLRKAVKRTCALTSGWAPIAVFVTAVWPQPFPAHAQTPALQQGRLSPQECVQPGEALFRIPELRSQKGKLRGTILLGDELRRLSDGTGDCALVYLRYFRGIDAVAPAGSPAPAPTKYTDPIPGPTLRARVGDLVQLTFLNQINPLDFAGSIDLGDNQGVCDQGTLGQGGVSNLAGYPANVSDTYPDCFHGSSTGNIHFHGTHTNPTSTGDNVFLQIRPSPRANGQPLVTAGSVAAPFDKFFTDCEAHLKGDVLSEWPRVWTDLPSSWTDEQEKFLDAFDKGTPPYLPPPKPLAQRVWPVNQRQIEGSLWPQYYAGAFPYCFQLPDYTAATWPPPAGTPLKMGQSPGTHWYHAHKHGSTAINVSNGMTGAFIIEGQYDDRLNEFYGKIGDDLWTRTQPVLVLNELGNTPNLVRNNQRGYQDIVVNGKPAPLLGMKPGEVQLWRIVNTSPRASAFLAAPPKLDPTRSGIDPTTDFEWKQLAQDGVQFADTNYQSSLNKPLMIAPGNRVDLLVKAPSNAPGDPKRATYPFLMTEKISRAPRNDDRPSPSTPNAPKLTLLSVLVSGTAPENPKQRQFIPKAPFQPPFLADITDDEVRFSPRRTIVFDSKSQRTPHQHTINGEQFTETGIGVTTFLNTAEEWKIVNTTPGLPPKRIGTVDHPFHIHINPFQIVEVFDPNEVIPDPDNPSQPPIPKYITDKPSTAAREKVQCQLTLTDPDTWKDCHNSKQSDLIWWDVFPIPSAAWFPSVDAPKVQVPGFFRMRSRFVDYPGLWVIHCHILAHEDRGMMTIVQVMPLGPTPVRHH